MSISTGPNLGLLQHGAQGEAHYNELLKFFRGVDGLVMLSVKSRMGGPPATPANGDRYLVAAAASGAWAGQAGKIARWSAEANAWEFFAPKTGWFTHVDDEDAVLRCVNGSWQLWLGKPSTGWAEPTGTASRSAFDTATVTTEQLAQRLKALIDDLAAQGRLAA